jgi:hypothetical protein
MRVTSSLARAVLATGTIAIAAVPGGAAAGESRAGDGARVVGSLGQFNFVDSGDGLVGGGLEYRWAPLERWALVPSVGVTVVQGGGAYGYAALRYEFDLGRSWIVAPLVGAGLFRNTDTLDLGHPVEFKTGLEVSLRVAGGRRIGLQAYHLSNASLDEDNPGTEVLELTFSIPVGSSR